MLRPRRPRPARTPSPRRARNPFARWAATSGLLLAFTSGEMDHDAAATALEDAGAGAPTAGLTGRGLFSSDGPAGRGLCRDGVRPQGQGQRRSQPRGEHRPSLRGPPQRRARPRGPGRRRRPDPAVHRLDQGRHRRHRSPVPTRPPARPSRSPEARRAAPRSVTSTAARRPRTASSRWRSRPGGPLGIGNTQSCSPRGTPSIVTRSDGQRLEEIDGRPAEEVYLEQLGFTGVAMDDEEFEALAESHPLAQPELHGDVRLRHVLERTGDGAIITGTQHPGERRDRVHLARVRRPARERPAIGCRRLAGDSAAETPKAALVFDCAGRRRALRDGLARGGRGDRRRAGGSPRPAGRPLHAW